MIFGFVKIAKLFLTQIQDTGDIIAPFSAQAWFIDQGTTLPSFLKAWHHRHVVEADGEDHAIIIDDNIKQ